MTEIGNSSTTASSLIFSFVQFLIAGTFLFIASLLIIAVISLIIAETI